MVYDADLQHIDNNISIDELITCLEMVGDKEMLDESDDPKSMWRAPSGRHLAKKKKSGERKEWEDAQISRVSSLGSNNGQPRGRSGTWLNTDNPEVDESHHILRNAFN